MNIVLIACIGKNNELGKDNKLLWKLPNDLKFFKEKTLNKIVVMGRKTYESLPRILPNRKNIVITKSLDYNNQLEIYRSVNEFLDKYKDFTDEIYIIGGGTIYSEFMKYADKMYLTEVNEEVSADVYFPKFDKNEWNGIEIDSIEENNIKYKHMVYIKNKYN